MFLAWKNLSLLLLYFNIILIALKSENGNKTGVFLISWLGSFNFHYFFRSYSDLFVPTQCRCRGLLLHLITLSDSHIRQDLTGRGTGPSQRPANTQQSQEREISIPPGGFERAFLPMYVYIHLCVCLYTHTHTHIYIYIHPHTVYQIPEAVKRCKLYCLKEQ
jgi:hypothetical protein